MKTKKVISYLLLASLGITMLSSCGSNGDDSSSTKNEQSGVTNQITTGKTKNDPNKIEYNGGAMYQSSNCKITLQSIELTWNGMHYESDPYNAVNVSVLVENLSSQDISYEANTVYINGFKLHTSSRDSIFISLSGNSKSVESFAITKDQLDKSGISQIEDIKFEDYYLIVGPSYKHEGEKLSNAEASIDPPYSLNWN